MTIDEREVPPLNYTVNRTLHPLYAKLHLFLRKESFIASAVHNQCSLQLITSSEIFAAIRAQLLSRSIQSTANALAPIL